MVRLWCLVLVVGCGRVGFAPRDGSVDSIASNDASDASDAAVATGLVAWYPMTSIGGGRVPDATGHGHDATCTACPIATAGHGVTAALRFDGATTFLQVPDAPELDFSAGFTIALWALIDQVPASGYQSFAMRPIGTANENSFALDVATSGTVEYFSQSGSVYGTTTIAPATWFHFATTYSGTKTVFVNGMAQGSGPGGSVVFDTNAMFLGVDEIGGGALDDFLAGGLSDVRLYDRVLSPAEIATLAGL